MSYFDRAHASDGPPEPELGIEWARCRGVTKKGTRCPTERRVKIGTVYHCRWHKPAKRGR